MSALRSPDWSRMLDDIIASGMNERAIVDRLGLTELSPQLLRHYAAGVQPNFPRGFALYVLWMEAMDKPESDIPWIDYVPPHRAEGNGQMTLTQKCTACGQKMRGRILERWQQLQIHHETHGDRAVMPSWLDPASAARTAKAAKALGLKAKGARRVKRETATEEN